MRYLSVAYAELTVPPEPDLMVEHYLGDVANTTARLLGTEQTPPIRHYAPSVSDEYVVEDELLTSCVDAYIGGDGSSWHVEAILPDLTAVKQAKLFTRAAYMVKPDTRWLIGAVRLQRHKCFSVADMEDRAGVPLPDHSTRLTKHQAELRATMKLVAESLRTLEESVRPQSTS